MISFEPLKFQPNLLMAASVWDTRPITASAGGIDNMYYISQMYPTEMWILLHLYHGAQTIHKRNYSLCLSP